MIDRHWWWGRGEGGTRTFWTSLAELRSSQLSWFWLTSPSCETHDAHVELKARQNQPGSSLSYLNSTNQQQEAGRASGVLQRRWHRSNAGVMQRQVTGSKPPVWPRPAGLLAFHTLLHTVNTWRGRWCMALRLLRLEPGWNMPSVTCSVATSKHPQQLRENFISLEIFDFCFI